MAGDRNPLFAARNRGEGLRPFVEVSMSTGIDAPLRCSGSVNDKYQNAEKRSAETLIPGWRTLSFRRRSDSGDARTHCPGRREIEQSDGGGLSAALTQGKADPFEQIVGSRSTYRSVRDGRSPAINNEFSGFANARLMSREAIPSTESMN
jgi:hypothetical protein